MKLKKTASSGFTLVELLIGIALSSMIFLAVSSTIMVLFTSSARTKQFDTLEQAKNDLASDFTTNVRWAKDISISSDQNELTLTTVENETVRYTVNSQGRLLENGQPITTADIIITDVTFANYSNSGAYSSVRIDIAFEHARFKTLEDSVRVVVSQRAGVGGP